MSEPLPLPDDDLFSPDFGDHLETLRRHLIRALIVFFIFTVLAFIFKNILFDNILFAPQSADFLFNRWLCMLGETLQTSALCIQDMNFKLINTQVTGQFMMHITISLTAGFILSAPYLLYELWKFVKPALTVKEITAVRGIVMYASLLFFTGVMFGYFIITPLGLNFFGNYVISESLQNLFTIQSYISIVNKSCLTTGLAFELPMVIFFLSHAGIVTPAVLKKYRRHAVIILFIAAALLTPADPFSMILVALPLLLLYEFSIGISRRVYKRKSQRKL